MKFFHSFKEWLGCQAYVSVKILYREPLCMKWGKPSIWLSNRDPRNELDGEDVAWMEKNCIFVECNEPIVRAST